MMAEQERMIGFATSEPATLRKRTAATDWRVLFQSKFIHALKREVICADLSAMEAMVG